MDMYFHNTIAILFYCFCNCLYIVTKYGLPYVKLISGRLLAKSVFPRTQDKKVRGMSPTAYLQGG